MPTNPNHGETPGEYTPPGNELVNYPTPGAESAGLGYETTDVNVGNVIVFLGGLFGFVLIFFVFCFGMGKLINNGLAANDGPVDKWHQRSTFAGSSGTSLDNLTSNTAMQQRALQQMTAQFPSPRLDIDDGNQATADLHAKEDLLLEHYSTVPGEQGIRIPIERAMEIIAQKGLPVMAEAAPKALMAGDEAPKVQAPLTSGFARTGFELDVIEAREQKINYGKAEASAHSEQAQPK
jgi:hypothetical protein